MLQIIRVVITTYRTIQSYLLSKTPMSTTIIPKHKEGFMIGRDSIIR